MLSDEAVRICEYASAVNPIIPQVPAAIFPASLYEDGPSREIPLDLSSELGHTPWPATSPNLLASFVRVRAGETVTLSIVATSLMCFVIRGAGETRSSGAASHVSWSTGDVFTLPSTAASCVHSAREDAVLYTVHDAPLLRYLGCVPSEARFPGAHYTRARLEAEVELVRHAPGAAHRNRLGVLLSNAATDSETRTLTHVLWGLLNSLPPRTRQPPHRHNSVALDLAVLGAAPESEGVYTLMGPELGEDGWVRDPIKRVWRTGAMFVTPPGWWHRCVQGGG